MINGSCYKNAVISGANNIISHKEEINALNIFPVPDGDTGTNMSMTIAGAVEALENMDSQNVSEIASATASAMLKSARGNSGVILSLLFRGIANGLKGAAVVDGKELSAAMREGVTTAYKAVMNPTEGTILTVARMACEAGELVSETEDDAVAVFGTICSAANTALESTPDMLPVLKKAGVVDAGGKGLCLIFEGMLSLIRDGIMVENKSSVSDKQTDKEEATAEFFRNAAAEFDSVINFTYCTEFIIGKNPDITKSSLELKAYLENIGDCVVVADDDDIIKVHVHTENPGKAIEEALTFGQLLKVKIENMKEQHRKAAEKYAAEKAKAEAEEKKRQSLKPVAPVDEIGFVSVATGAGIEEVFKDLGCHQIVNGGQSMNPSTEDIFEAVMATPAKPMVKDRNVIIIPTKTIPQGLVALIAYSDEASVELNAEYMTSAAKKVSTGQVTYAARNSEFGNTKIKEGEIIALNNGKLTYKSKDPVHAAVKLAKEMVNRDTSYVTIIYGNGITDAQADSALQSIQSKVGSNVEVSLINGGQPIYYFILSVE